MSTKPTDSKYAFNPLSATIAVSHPDAEDDFYDKFWLCTTLGEINDLIFNAMHVEGRKRALDMRRLERKLERLRNTAGS